MRWVARASSGMNEDRTAAGVRHIGMRLEDLASDRRSARSGARLGGGQLDARRRRAVGVPACVRHVDRPRRADRRVRPGQRARGDSRSLPAASASSTAASHGPGRLRPHQIDCGAGIGDLPSRPVLLSRSCSAASCTPPCESDRGASSGASVCVVSATSRPIHRTTNAPSTSRSASPSSAGRSATSRPRSPVARTPAATTRSSSQPRLQQRVMATTTGSYCRAA